MPSLYERLTVPPLQTDKIPLHHFQEIMRQYHYGFISVTDIINEFNLDAGQQASAAAIYSASNLAPDARVYFDLLFGRLALGEGGVMPSEFNETNFNAWIAGF